MVLQPGSLGPRAAGHVVRSGRRCPEPRTARDIGVRPSPLPPSGLARSMATLRRGGAVNFGAGFGDVVTFGLTRHARSVLGIENVNRCSSWYAAGEVAGVGATAATGFVGGSRWFARQASSNNWSNFSHSGTPASWQRGSAWSRNGNRANGDYIPTTGTRPDLHDFMDATAAGIGGKYPTWPSWRRAINRTPYTPGGALYGGASAGMNSCECSQ